ncbi:sulfite exporter TauE/SafE family protein [Arcticibacter sp. MXS-1]|uniref:sulfite exporter TauE/SafE family protein n=1 Tax=Arcticibacter sp. MXS-1 TaxID=3341726 RepID=UPI0035A8E154
MQETQIQEQLKYAGKVVQPNGKGHTDYRGLRVLIVGPYSEAVKTVTSLKNKKTEFYADILLRQTDDSLQRIDTINPDWGTVEGPVDGELISGYDLVLLKDEDERLTKTILQMGREHDVVVSLISRHDGTSKPGNAVLREERYWRKIASRCIFALGFILLGSVIASYYPLKHLLFALQTFAVNLDLDASFGLMLLAGFVAQLVDGALGMGYGVISTTMLLSTGLNPAAISGSIHTAEMFSSGASGFSHYRFGNINKKLFRTLLIPGILGAVAGALLLSYLGEEYGKWLRPALSVYTLLLGLRILLNAFKKKSESRKVRHAGWLAGAGGFLDSFGGGGWGPLVTSTLISKGKTPRYIIGTVSLTEFFVTLGSALTFFIVLGTSHIETIAGLIIGGVLAAPLAAKLTGKLKTRTMLVGVGVLVILSSLRIILKATGVL